jgi:hypothetical protein
MAEVTRYKSMQTERFSIKNMQFGNAGSVAQQNNTKQKSEQPPPPTTAILEASCNLKLNLIIAFQI